MDRREAIGNGCGQAGLADTAHTVQRHRHPRSDLIGDVHDQLVPSNQRRGRDGPAPPTTGAGDRELRTILDVMT